jgi:hypothetical protein
MHAINKFNYFVIGTTIFIMFLLFPKLKPLVDTHFTPDIITTYVGQTGKDIFSAAIGLLVSLGVYKSLAFSVHGAFSNIRYVKKFFLGPAFVEGTWVGFYGPKDKPYYAIDVFEQSLANTSMFGGSYLNQSEQRSNWIGRIVHIDETARILSFHCEVSIISENKKTDAITEFMLVRGNNNVPHRMNGNSSNISDGHMIEVHMKKLSDNTVYDKVAALNAAIEYRKEFTCA